MRMQPVDLRRWCGLLVILALGWVGWGLATALEAGASGPPPETGVIKGKVRASPGTPVTLQGTGITTRLDAGGSFELRGVPVGIFYTLVIGPYAEEIPPYVQPYYLVLYNIRLSRPGETVDLGTLDPGLSPKIELLAPAWRPLPPPDSLGTAPEPGPAVGSIRGRALVPAGTRVTVEGTGLTAAVQESGLFEIHGVPTGRFFTVVVGPYTQQEPPYRDGLYLVRYNVRIRRPGDVVDLGTLSPPTRFELLPHST